MSRSGKRAYDNASAVLTSMHAKERVIAPILREELGLIVELAAGVDTDRFGAFSREVERTGSQLDAARGKISAGFANLPSARVGLASEGSFGPHPHFPFVAIGRELVLMIDRETGLELTGYDVSMDTNFAHVVVEDLDSAREFAGRVGFPEHGLIVSGWRDDRPAPDLFLAKDITDAAALEAALLAATRLGDRAFVETDMRAHRNPTRMAAIERATRDLSRRFHSRCPNCDHRGFDVTERIPGLPCAWCGEPTREIIAERLYCSSCGYEERRSITTSATADPGRCDGCNP